VESLQKTLRLPNSSKAEIVGIFEARRLSRWWRNTHGLLLNPDKALEALRFLRYLRKNKLKVNAGRVISKVQESKTKTAKEIQIKSLKREKIAKGATDEYLECDLIAMSYGFTPDLTIPSILNLKTVNKFSDEIVWIDSNQRTSKLGVWAAGEITGIGGHELAIREGEIAAFDIVGKSNSLASAMRKLDRWRKRIFADGLARIYKVSDRWFDWSDEDVIVCRCEEVTRDEILSSFTELGADSVRTSKLFTRAGMGMCQGRFCHRNVQDMARLFGSENTKTNRPIGGAVTLGELSD
jgi:NAD(P)H-nitrite reductase large subunit